MDFASLPEKKEYEFLRTDPHLGRRIMLLGVSGSYAYGTNVEGSDIDFRGITLNRPEELLGLSSFEQYTDTETDTVIFAFNKIIPLLLNCNPNTIELLGLEPEQYVILTDTGRSLLDHSSLFLSKAAIQAFGGYADAQLRRLQNALARDAYPQQEKEQHILNSIRNAMATIQSRYADPGAGMIRLYLDEAVNPELEKEIFMDVSLTHYPLRDYRNLWSEMNNIVRDYEKLSIRKGRKDELHLNKHAMHLIRLFMTGIDILEKGVIRTCRREEHELLMRIRRGEFMTEDGRYRAEFFDLVRDYEEKMAYAAAHTELPDKPDMRAVEEFVIDVNRKALEIGE